jgi:hypothetical protein
VVKILHILTFCAVAGVFAVLGLLAGGWNRPDPALEGILDGPGVVERFRSSEGSKPSGAAQVAPLIASAQELALHLNPPPPEPPAAQATPEPVTRSTDVKPVISSVNFKLVATSYYEGRPDKSMALLSELGGTDGGRWVREGTQVGHFTVHEIRQGMVVLRDGDNVRELAVERAAIQQGLVKEVRPAASQAKAAVHDGNEMPPSPSSGLQGKLGLAINER